MLKLSAMTSGDAQHTLKVYQWIQEHLEEITILAENGDETEVSAQEVQKEFHQTYTSLECTRFVPLTVVLSTDETALADKEVVEPNVVLYNPSDRNVFVALGALYPSGLSNGVPVFGICSDERTWRRLEM